MINFGSNDYLGLAADPRLAQAVVEAIKQEGWGSGASPLITGHAALHAELEQRLAEIEGTEAALLFPSGFAANLGAIAALVGPGDVVYHRSQEPRQPVGRLPALAGRRPRLSARRLAAAGRAAGPARSGKHRRRLIVSDSLFSMDGDLAPLAELAEVAAPARGHADDRRSPRHGRVRPLAAAAWPSISASKAASTSASAR